MTAESAPTGRKSQATGDRSRPWLRNATLWLVAAGTILVLAGLLTAISGLAKEHDPTMPTAGPEAHFVKESMVFFGFLGAAVGCGLVVVGVVRTPQSRRWTAAGIVLFLAWLMWLMVPVTNWLGQRLGFSELVGSLNLVGTAIGPGLVVVGIVRAPRSRRWIAAVVVVLLVVNALSAAGRVESWWDDLDRLDEPTGAYVSYLYMYDMVPAGEWERVADAPASDYGLTFSTVDSGILASNGSLILQWQPGASSFEEVWRSRSQLAAVAGVDNTVFMFEVHDGRLSNIYRLDLDTRMIGPDPIAPGDDRGDFFSLEWTSTVVVDGVIYLAGGVCGVCGYQFDVWSYTPDTHEFMHETTIEIPNQKYEGQNGFVAQPAMIWDGSSILISYKFPDPNYEVPDGSLASDYFQRIWAFDPASSRARILHSYIKPTGAPPVLDGNTMWSVAGRCVQRFNETLGQWDAGEYAVPMEFNGWTRLSVSWKGDQYIYSSTARYTSPKGEGLTELPPALWRWNPPEPGSWRPTNEDLACEWG